MADIKRRPWRAIRWLLMLTGLFVVGATVQKATSVESARGKHETPPSPQAQHAGHETEDISASSTTGVLAAMAATTALVIGIVFLMTWRFDVARQHSFASITPLQKVQVEPPRPRLEVNPLAELARRLAAQKHLLDSYGWVNADHSTARIPIDRAMALTVGKSLDTQP